jgi:hypothetical protein
MLESREELFKTLQSKYILLRMKMYYYNFNYFLNDNWEMAFLMSSTLLKQYEDLDYVRVYKLGDITLRRESGWHFTYFMSPEDIVRKLGSFSHADINIYPFNVPEYLNFVIKNGIDYQQREDFKLQNISIADFDIEQELFPTMIFMQIARNLRRRIPIPSHQWQQLLQQQSSSKVQQNMQQLLERFLKVLVCSQ